MVIILIGCFCFLLLKQFRHGNWENASSDKPAGSVSWFSDTLPGSKRVARMCQEPDDPRIQRIRAGHVKPLPLHATTGANLPNRAQGFPGGNPEGGNKGRGSTQKGGDPRKETKPTRLSRKKENFREECFQPVAEYRFTRDHSYCMAGLQSLKSGRFN